MTVDVATFPTTLMIKNLPCRSSPLDVLTTVDGLGFAGCYDFFYLPRRHGPPFAKPQNYGYAFINFQDPGTSFAFSEKLRTGKTSIRRSDKVLTVSAADIQGVENLQKHFEGTACTRSLAAPIFAADAAQSGSAKKDIPTATPTPSGYFVACEQKMMKEALLFPSDDSTRYSDSELSDGSKDKIVALAWVTRAKAVNKSPFVVPSAKVTRESDLLDHLVEPMYIPIDIDFYRDAY